MTTGGGQIRIGPSEVCVRTAWVRLSSTCNNRCLFCLDADRLDGSVVPIEDVRAAIDAAVAGGAERVVLSGGEPTLSKHLLAAIRYVRERGAVAALTTNGRIIQHEKVARMLESAGLQEASVSIHGGRRATHDGLVGVEGAWVESLAAARLLARTSIRVTAKVLYNRHNRGEMEHLMHMITMAGGVGFELRALAPLGAAAPGKNLEALETSLRDAISMIGTLWYSAKEEGLLFTTTGFDDTAEHAMPPEGGPLQADRSLIRLLRRRVAMPRVAGGTTAVDADGMVKDFGALVEESGGLAQAGLELAALGAPALDLPPCVGGRREDEGPAPQDAVKTSACAMCPRDAVCHGLARKLGKHEGGSLGPLPSWLGAGAGARIALVASDGAGDRILHAHTLPALAAALEARGARVLRVGPGEPLPEADRVLFEDATVARGEGTILDFTARGVRGGSHERVACLPSQIGAWREAGLPLRRLGWRPYPVPPIEPVGSAADATRAVLVGESADWDRVATALSLAGPGPTAFEAFAPAAVTLPRAIRRDPEDEEAILAAIASARFVVVPLGRGVSLQTLARDARWIQVALALGRPVIAPRLPAAVDLVRHEVDGLLYTPADPADLARSIHALDVGPAVGRLAAAAQEGAARASVGAWADELLGGAPPMPRRRPDAVRPWRAW